MTFAEFAALVRLLRDRQRRYLKTRTPAALDEARAMERRVDAALAALAEGRGLFDEPPQSGGWPP